METSPTQKEIRANALRFARNTWRRFGTYKKRYMVKYGRTTSEPTPQSYFNNRLLEDSFAIEGGANSLPHGHKIERRQNLANAMMEFRAGLTDPAEFDKIYAESIAKRMPGYAVEISKAMSASSAVHEKDSIRTFVTKTK